MVIKILVYSFVHIYIYIYIYFTSSLWQEILKEPKRDKDRIIAPQLQRNSTCSLAFN